MVGYACNPENFCFWHFLKNPKNAKILQFKKILLTKF